jgi:putative flavoprotein involved in K+ transport
MNSLPHQYEPAKRVERFETVVVGGGQAALAVGHHLAQRDLDFVMVSDEARIGDNWRRRWDSLRLFTPARYSGLPGMPFPATPGHFAGKDAMADYLERYASRFDLPIRMNARVRSVRWTGAKYSIGIQGEAPLLEADNVIVATGAFQIPRVPALSARLASAIHQLHSSQYRGPFDLPAGSVLVVGAGNSGAQIALELSRFRKVWLAGRDTGHMPRRVLGRDVFDWIWPVMKWATSDTRLGKHMRRSIRGSGDALVGIPERQLRDAGIVRLGRLEEVRGGLPVCGNEVVDPQVVVWCTGYRADYGWLDCPIFDEQGLPRHERGVVSEMPGLYFLGLRFQHRLNSSLIGGVGEDAAFIAQQVALRSGEPGAAEAALPGVANVGAH